MFFFSFTVAALPLFFFSLLFFSLFVFLIYDNIKEKEDTS